MVRDACLHITCTYTVKPVRIYIDTTYTIDTHTYIYMHTDMSTVYIKHTYIYMTTDMYEFLHVCKRVLQFPAET